MGRVALQEEVGYFPFLGQRFYISFRFGVCFTCLLRAGAQRDFASYGLYCVLFTVVTKHQLHLDTLRAQITAAACFTALDGDSAP